MLSQSGKGFGVVEKHKTLGLIVRSEIAKGKAALEQDGNARVDPAATNQLIPEHHVAFRLDLESKLKC